MKPRLHPFILLPSGSGSDPLLAGPCVHPLGIGSAQRRIFICPLAPQRFKAPGSGDQPRQRLPGLFPLLLVHLRQVPVIHGQGKVRRIMLIGPV